MIRLKDKRGITITNSFLKILYETKRKPNKIWVDKGSVYYNRPMKSFFQNNDIEMYSMYKEGKSVIPEKFLKNKLYKYMTSISKHVCIHKLDDIVKKYNNTYHSTIKMKPVDVKSNTYIASRKEINDEDPKFEIGDIGIIPKFKNVFARGYVPNWSEEVFVIKKVKNIMAWAYVNSDLRDEEIVRMFYEKELQKINQKELIVEKVIKRKGDKLYVKWKGYDNSFNSWIDKKHSISE